MKILEEIFKMSGVHERCQMSNFSTCGMESMPTILSPTSSPSPSPDIEKQDNSSVILEDQSSQDSSGGGDTGDAEQKLTPETIIIIVIGGVLFIVLIVLVVILIACLCCKRGGRLHLMAKAEVESIGKSN